MDENWSRIVTCNCLEEAKAALLVGPLGRAGTTAHTRDPNKNQTSIWVYHKGSKIIAPFGDAYEKIGTIQRRLAWPLHKDDTLFQSGRPTGLNIYFFSFPSMSLCDSRLLFISSRSTLMTTEPHFPLSLPANQVGSGSSL